MRDSARLINYAARLTLPGQALSSSLFYVLRYSCTIPDYLTLQMGLGVLV